MEIKIPRHIAIIMGGNATWAKKKGLTTQEGHAEGSKNIIPIVDACREIGINFLTLYAFSTENWKRPKDEVDNLLKLLDEFLKQKSDELNNRDLKIKIIGRLDGLNNSTVSSIRLLEEQTSKNKGLNLSIAFGYGGRAEIIDATKKIAEKVKSGELRLEDITEKVFDAHLYYPYAPDPDLMIRTGGGYRTSNFLTWQGIYTEFYSTNLGWPEFTKKDLNIAIEEYSSRKRTFGERIDDIESITSTVTP